MSFQELATSVQPNVSDDTLVYQLDIFILAVILFLFLVNVPRALVRLANGSEIFQGHSLRYVTLSQSSLQVPSGFVMQTNEKGLASSTLTSISPDVATKQPWRLPMYFSSMHPIASFIHRRIYEDYTVVHVFLMAGYTAAVFYAAFFASNPFSDPHRAGWVITSQIPFVYAFATKNNVIGMLIGVGYEKLNYMHRYAGRLMVIGANVHALGYIYKWSFAGDLPQKIAQPYIQWGFAALVCFDLLGFFSTQYVRSKSYNLFMGTHVVGLLVVLISACYHQEACIPYVIAASVIYGLDHLLRAVKTCITTATLRPIPELGLTQVDVPLNSGWRAGQHVRLRILSTAMGLWGMTEAHPFTIASATKTEEGLVLMCKKTGRWTNKVYELAESTSFGESGQKLGRRVKVMVEGPYGGVGNTVVSTYSGAMFVVGGSGVTFALSAVQDLVQAGRASTVQFIDIIWSIPDPAALSPFIPLFTSLLLRSTSVRLRISVFYTRASTTSIEGMFLPPGLTLVPARPKIGQQLDGLVTSMMSSGAVNGAFVGVCGPISLARDVADTVRIFDANLKKAVGGIEYHQEIFGW